LQLLQLVFPKRGYFIVSFSGCRLTRESLSDFAATCEQLKRRRQEHLSAGSIIPEPPTPSVLPRRPEAATPQPGKLLEVEAATPAAITQAAQNALAVVTAETHPAEEMDTSEMCEGMCISGITTGAQLIVRQDVSGEAQHEITNESSIPIDRNVTEEQYRRASVELAKASEMRQAAHDLREEKKQAQEEAAWLHSCKNADHQLAEEQLRSATETRRQLGKLQTTAETIQRNLRKLLRHAEEDRRKAATLRSCAMNTHERMANMQKEAEEERRQAAELLSTARNTNPNIQELVKVAEENRQKARQLMAECKALKQKTVTNMESRNEVGLQAEQNVETTMHREQQAEHQALVGEEGHTNNDAMEISDNDDLVVLEPPGHIQRNPAPRQAQIEEIVDLEFEELERQTYRNQVELAMQPDARGVLWPFIEDYEPEDRHFNAVLPDPALTAPHGTRSRGPTICLNCDVHIATCVMVPCGHMVVCGPCGATLQTTTRRCPACKKGATNNALAIRVYSL
jgi:Zinc finger, C3HC4 type (RING finger)